MFLDFTGTPFLLYSPRTWVSSYIVNVWKIFLDRLSRFDDAVSNVTVHTYR